MADEIRHVTPEQWGDVDKLVTELLHEPYLLGKFPHMKGSKGAKVIKYSRAVEVLINETGDKFKYDIMNLPNRIWNEKPVVRKSIPIFIDHQDNDLSAKLSVQSLLVQEELEANKKMYDLISEVIYHGKPLEVPGSEGMVNFTGISSAAASAVWTTALAFAADLEVGVASMRAAHIRPPYDLIVTPGVLSELRGNYIANIGNEWKEFKETYMPRLIANVYDTDAITTDGSGNQEDLVTDNQCFLLVKNDPTVFYIAETEGIGRLNIPTKEFEADITYLKIWGGTFIPKNVDGIYLCYNGTTTTAY
ncbi:hypothetical protein LCGC14_0720430 [marine sediment metagenome]|uniref:Capsid protein n=1 Tax=marine sediment metagenome TaxID=412755 RepID=A0A0F9QCJ6_9ZZZZ